MLTVTLGLLVIGGFFFLGGELFGWMACRKPDAIDVFPTVEAMDKYGGATQDGVIEAYWSGGIEITKEPTLDAILEDEDLEMEEDDDDQDDEEL